MVAGAALYLYLTDKHVIVFNNGTIQTVDDKDIIFLNDGTILYDDSIIEQNEIKYYSKRQIKHLFLDFSNSANSKWNVYESDLNNFFTDNNISSGFQLAIPLAILALIVIFLIWLRLSVVKTLFKHGLYKGWLPYLISTGVF